MDRVVSAALQVDFAAASAPSRSSRRPLWAIAASLVIVVVGALAWLLNPRDTFAAQVVEHVNGEAFALARTQQPTDPAQLAAILSHAGVRLKPDAVLVSYASPCEFRGHVVPHLVVQTAAGPVAVMVLANENVGSRTERVDEPGYRGVIVPAPRGAVAVLGQDGDVASVAATVLAALDYAAR